MTSRDTFAMPPEAFVTALYQAGLGRSPDPEGLAAWTRVLNDTGDPTLLMREMIDSSEYRNRSAAIAEADGAIRTALQAASPTDLRQLADRALARLGRRPRLVDVGAQSLGKGKHPYSPLLDYTSCEVVGFDPLEARIRERAANEAAHGLTLLPYAIGDGGTHTLYINSEDGTSSLYPLNADHNAAFNHLTELRTVRTESVYTHRLDDVLPPASIDLLKLDIQGAELMALRGAERSLLRTAAIHCEIEFAPIYAGQPLYHEVHAHLALCGFELIDLLFECRYHYLVPSGRHSPDRLLWADAVFFRVTEDPEVRAAQALLSAIMYRKPTLAEHLLLARTG